MNKEETIKILKRYLPEGSVDTVYYWLEKKKIHFRISRKRSTKLGDYKPPVRYPNHRISVNHNLNPYAFLITFTHELAHLLVYEKYGNTVKPHGNEWKREYKALMIPYLENNIFPGELKKALMIHLENSRASSNTDIALTKILKTYDKKEYLTGAGSVYLETLSEGERFVFGNNRIFLKLEKRRTRFRCKELKTGRLYLFHPLAEVIPLNNTTNDIT